MKRTGLRMFKWVCSICISFMVIALSTVIQEDHCGADDALKTPFAKGETVTYSIKKLKLTVGTATLTFHGLVSLNGREAVEILLTAKGFRFFDEEKIYLDPVTLYPIVIRRDLDIFGVKEKIDEFYDLERGKVRIVKTAKGVTSEQTLTGSERFDNIYGFIYRYRRSGQLVAGEEFTLHLPMRDVKFKLVEHKKIRVANRDFDAYYMDSVPKKYKVWFDSGPQMIPLMIDGAIGFGHTSMVMTAYAPGR